jgi:bifunctional ADP-heptose synthase (sugar kinase/adenylyltransferase)
MLQELLQKIRDTRVLVVGDSMLDRYWYGGVERISPEAPVPVIAVDRCDERPGGAANVARNVQALGAKCDLLSVSGSDNEADTLERLLREEGVNCRLQRDKLAQLLDRYLENLRQFQLVVVSDYGKGGLGSISEMIAAARSASIPVVVDPKGDDYSLYRGADLLTPNRKEFEHVVGRFSGQKELDKKASALASSFELGAVLVTRGEEGMSLIKRNGEALHYPARAREVFDVTGAGDTVIATVGCAFAAGGGAEDALHLANIAAGVVVGKLGATTATPDEILHELAIEQT